MTRCLIIGAQSSAAMEFIDHCCDWNFFGVSSKKLLAEKGGRITTVHYDDVSKFGSVDFDYVLILASRLPSEKIEDKDYNIAIDKIMRALKALSQCFSSATKFLFVSSFAVYSPDLGIIREGSKALAHSPYAKSKLSLESLLGNFVHDHGASLLICRMPVFVYFGGKNNFLSKVIERTRNGESISLSNPHSYFTALFDVECLSDLIKAKWSGVNVLNCGADRDLTFNHLSEIALNWGARDVHWKHSERPSQQVDISQVSDILGYRPSAERIVRKIFRRELG